MKYYEILQRQYNIFANDYVLYIYYIKTEDIYHFIGKKYCTTLEKIERIDYIEIPEKTYEEMKNVNKTIWKG